ncbi:hypothetical protein N0V91_003597 [Didymella pomorum]|uniref:Uncharacterized protein n=1 Tax=Didymella pomorum TaxID=749634 RepID=A0A9W8ZG50_9PLEO|nr:hypothetical protein N0V91_003597 [Didymella pomorum]
MPPYIAANPKLFIAMHAFFEGDRGSRALWIDWFHMQEKLVDDSSKLVDQNDILLVDVAGGRGHNLFGFKCKFAEYPGRILLFLMRGSTI